MAFFFLFSLLMLFSHQATGFEVFAFLLKTEESVWSRLPWQRITTVCLAGWSAGVYKTIPKQYCTDKLTFLFLVFSKNQPPKPISL